MLQAIQLCSDIAAATSSTHSNKGRQFGRPHKAINICGDSQSLRVEAIINEWGYPCVVSRNAHSFTEAPFGWFSFWHIFYHSLIFFASVAYTFPMGRTSGVPGSWNPCCRGTSQTRSAISLLRILSPPEISKCITLHPLTMRPWPSSNEGEGGLESACWSLGE